jgi:hypothetical protein
MTGTAINEDTLTPAFTVSPITPTVTSTPSPTLLPTDTSASTPTPMLTMTATVTFTPTPKPGETNENRGSYTGFPTIRIEDHVKGTSLTTLRMINVKITTG